MRCRKRGVLYVTSFLLAVWLTSMVTINLSTAQSGNNRKLNSNFTPLAASEHADVLGYRKKRVKPGSDVTEQIAEIARSLHRAKAHVRGTKTSDELNHAVGILDNMLQSFGIDKQTLLSRPVIEPSSVCPEKYMGSTYGYPFFYKGFETMACQHAKPISALVTIVAFFKDGDTQTVRTRTLTFLHSFINQSNLTVVIATNPTIELNLTLSERVSILPFETAKSDGQYLNQLVKNVKTPYVLVARDIDIFTEDARLERLVREIEMLQVPVAAGAVRYPDGHWKKGCYQSVHRNFTLRYLEGYDESMHECLFCDYIAGPFVASTTFLQSFPFSNLDSASGLFEDWFLRVQNVDKETIVCPDSMFHVYVQSVTRDAKDSDWKAFMDIWGLYKFITPRGRSVISDCISSGSFQGSRALSPCKLKANAVAVNFVMRLCETSGIICELQEGTSLGAVKFEKVLPWERDADITFLSANYSAFQKLQKIFSESGFNLFKRSDTWCCVDNRTAGGVFAVAFRRWTIELYGQHLMDSETLLASGNEPTRVLLDGQLVRVPRNPGLFVRNRYGHEIYQHAVHWMTTHAKSGWEPYSVNKFPPCDIPGNHDCLDRYNGDGDLPFSDPLP